MFIRSGIQRADAQLALSHRGSPPRCRRAPRSPGPIRRSTAGEARLRRLALELSAAEAVEVDQVARDATARPSRGDDLAAALEHEAVGARPGPRSAGSSRRRRRARTCRAAGRRRRRRPRTARAPRLIAIASTPPARRCRFARSAGTRPRPSAPPSSWIVCIGTTHSANRSPELELARVGDARSRPRDRRRGGASSASSSWSRSSAVTRWPSRARSSVDPAGAGADVEHGIAVLAGPARATARDPRCSGRTRGRARSRSSLAPPSPGSQNWAT